MSYKEAQDEIRQSDWVYFEFDLYQVRSVDDNTITLCHHIGDIITTPDRCVHLNHTTKWISDQIQEYYRMTGEYSTLIWTHGQVIKEYFVSVWERAMILSMKHANTEIADVRFFWGMISKIAEEYNNTSINGVFPFRLRDSDKQVSKEITYDSHLRELTKHD